MNAKQQEVKEQTSQSILTYDCGPKPRDTEKVKIYFDETGQNNSISEIDSGVRERLRQMRDVEIVYDRMESNIDVSFLTVESISFSGAPFAYLASLATFTPCQYKWCTFNGPLKDLSNHFVFVAGTTESLIGMLVSDLDTDEIEKARKMNAVIKKSSSEPR